MISLCSDEADVYILIEREFVCVCVCVCEREKEGGGGRSEPVHIIL